MSTAISVIGLLAAAVIFVIAIWKGLDVFTSTILVSFIIILTSWMNWWDSLTLYATGYVGFIQNNVFVLSQLQMLSLRKWVLKELFFQSRLLQLFSYT